LSYEMIQKWKYPKVPFCKVKQKRLLLIQEMSHAEHSEIEGLLFYFIRKTSQ